MAEKIDQYLKNKKFQSIVLIAKKGKILFTKGYGLADTVIYLIAQPHSETFTAVAIMQLEEKGLLNLDNPISQYFPDFPNGGSIQISHLLSKSFPS
ncbi:serine hydrolase [Lysinibacillus sp. BSL11]|nr:serine hydrolase domain-containing protein [Lysinibacillus boronitolerans]